MKILVFSDIHGAESVAERIVELAGAHAPDAILLLGDLLHEPRNRLPQGYAPRTTALLLSRLASRVIAVQGNCDREVDASLLPFPLSSCAWVLQDGIRVFATHGHRYHPGNMPPLTKGDVLLFGHTHVPMACTAPSGIHMCNPGSLALPKEGHPPSYGVFEQGNFSVFTDSGEQYMRICCQRQDES